MVPRGCGPGDLTGMDVRGSLSDFSVVDILQLFQISAKTGSLEVRDGQHTYVLYFDRGHISGAGASHWNLIAELRRIEWLAPEVREQLDLLKKDESNVGLSLIARALVTPAVWDQFVERQVETLIYPLFDLTQGEFIATVAVIPQVAPLRLDLVPQQVILNAARWQEELRRAEYAGAGPESVWQRAGTPGTGAGDDVILTLLTRPRSIDDLAAAAGLSVLATIERIRRLSREGWIEPVLPIHTPGTGAT